MGPARCAWQHPSADAEMAHDHVQEAAERSEQVQDSGAPSTPAASPPPSLKLREIDSNVAGPTQQLLAVLHGLQSELDSAGHRQHAVQVCAS